MPLFTNEDLDTNVNGPGAAAVNIQDGGNSITIDGTVTATPSGTQDVNLVSTIPVPVTDNGGSLTIDAVSLPLPTGAATAALQTQPGVDIGDVTVNNGAGAAAVNIQDGGNSITVDGTVAITGPVAVTGPLTDAELRATPVPVSFTAATTTLATVTSVAVSTTVATLSASNAAKQKVVVFNEAGTLFVKLGSGATSASYSYRLTANTTLEIEGYAGIVTAIKQSGTSAALVTEVGI
jgi:hypothetical protein